MRSSFDLSICCFLWNNENYLNGEGIRYVNKLYNSIERNTHLPFRFVCFTDMRKAEKIFSSNIEVEKIPSNLRVNGKTVCPKEWRGNLKKIIAFNPDNSLTGRVILFDLDVVIVKNIDHILSYDGFFCANKPDLNGSVVGFESKNIELVEKLWHPLCRNYNSIAQRTRGSERKYYMEKLFKDERTQYWQDLYPAEIVSYKNQGYSSEARIIYFHGIPKPHQLNVGWIKDNWR